MKIVCVCPSSYAANTYLLLSHGKAIIVDPSVSVAAVERALSEHSAELCGILLTHGHFDHTISIDTLREKYSIPLMMHKADAPMLTDGKTNGFYSFYKQERRHNAANILLNDADLIELGDEKIKLINTPGHSPGSSCFLCPDEDGGSFLITGDTLFSNTIGRCDLWQGDEKKMADSLKMLRELDPKMTIYPGHGPSHTLGGALEVALFYADF